LFGVVIPTLVGETINSKVILREDRVLDFRRLMGLEVLSWFFLIVALPIAAIAGTFVSDGTLWVRGFFSVLVISLPVRFLTIVSISSNTGWKKSLASLLPPILALILFLILETSPSDPLVIRGSVAFVIGLVISSVGVSKIIHDVERSGTVGVRDSPMSLFRIFLQHWLRSNQEPLEDRLRVLGTPGNIEGSILAFSGLNSPVGSVVVSNFHPGPYRDLGSAALPSRLKKNLEKSRGGVVQVPHGISNHQLNIVSQKDVERVIQTVVEDYPVKTTINDSSPMIRSNVEEAKVSGQLFGNVALLTLTLAPTDMEDLPSSIQDEIERAAHAHGMKCVIADAHNSISNQTSITSAQAQKLVEASVKVLDQLAQARKTSFRAGSAVDPLEEFRLQDGIGPGGLSALVVQSGNQVVAYITIDGNNMLTGLRAAILEELESVGISGGEVMTTDTHLVTGLVRSRLGYYPVGAHIDTRLIIQKTRETVHSALARMEVATAGFSDFSIQVGVLGSETFRSITNFVGYVAGRIARQFYTLEALTLVATLVVLFYP
jgi:predicted neutral ceramidase superfamily lipid hydrolase